MATGATKQAAAHVNAEDQKLINRFARLHQKSVDVKVSYAGAVVSSRPRISTPLAFFLLLRLLVIHGVVNAKFVKRIILQERLQETSRDLQNLNDAYEEVLLMDDAETDTQSVPFQIGTVFVHMDQVSLY